MSFEGIYFFQIYFEFKWNLMRFTYMFNKNIFNSCDKTSFHHQAFADIVSFIVKQMLVEYFQKSNPSVEVKKSILVFVETFNHHKLFSVVVILRI